MIKAALFDYGGVLSKSGQTRSIEKMLGEYWQVDPGQLDIKELQVQFQRAKISSEEFFEGLLAKYPGNAPLDEEAFLQRDEGLYNPAPEVYKLAQKMRDHGIATGIISNVFPISAAKIRELGGYNFFHPVILSCEVGMVKPDPQIYELAVKDMGLEPGNVIYVDDDPKNLEPARRMGIFTVHASSETQLMTALPAILANKNDLDIKNNGRGERT